MSPESRFCAQCGKPAVPDAAFCAFCGNAIRPIRREPSSRAIAAPDRGKLDSPCAVIYAGQEEMDVRRVGRLVAETVQRPLPDVTRKMRTSKGFLATGLAPESAVALAERAEKELKAPILVIPDDECVPLPLAMRMRQAALDSDGLRCEAYTWDLTERVSATWNAVFLISCGRLQIEEVAEERDSSPTKTGLFMRRAPNLVTNVRYEYLLDLILFEPNAGQGAEGWRRLRIDQNTSAFSLTEMKQDPDQRVGPLYRSAVNIERYAAGVPANPGVSLLASGASDAAWQSLTFLSKADFDMYSHWLMQLVRYGRPIPA